MRHMKISLCTVALFLLVGAPAVAQSCDAIERFLAGQSAAQSSADLSEGATCDGAPQTVCQWEYGYRHAAAQDLFNELVSQLAACLGPELTSDAPVNHPDSYDLRQFRSQIAGQGVDVFLSIKDKVAIQKTYVFLRASPSETN